MPVAPLHRPLAPPVAGGFGHALSEISATAPFAPSSPHAPLQLGRTKLTRRAKGKEKENQNARPKGKQKAYTRGKPSARRAARAAAPTRSPTTHLQVHAFNIGHFSKRSTAYKLRALRAHLEEHSPDLLALSEVNDPSVLEAAFGGEDSDYELVLPTEFQTGQTRYVEKKSAQNEIYPLLVRKASGLSATFVGKAPREPASSEASIVRPSKRGEALDPWADYRPAPLFAVTHPEYGSFLLGSVHTSPGKWLGTQVASYARGTQGVLDRLPGGANRGNVPGLLIGDFYNPHSNAQKAKVSALKDRFVISRPKVLTNYAPQQEDTGKLAADYAIATKGFLAGGARATRAFFPPFPGSQQGFEKNPAKSWAKYPSTRLGLRGRATPRQVSDHAPVGTTVRLGNAHTAHKTFVRAVKRAIAQEQASLAEAATRRKAASVSSGALLGTRQATRKRARAAEETLPREPPKKRRKVASPPPSRRAPKKAEPPPTPPPQKRRIVRAKRRLTTK